MCLIACPAGAANELIEISTAEELASFAEYVTSDNQEVDAVLLADIDYTAYDKVIGASCSYCGTFDGRGHKITYALSGSSDYLGLFNNLGGTGVIKNLIIDGTLTTSGKNAGALCGQSSGVISNCVSYVTILSTHEGDSGHGGFVGQTYNDARFEFCTSAGKFVSEISTHCGGYVGWKGWGTTIVQSCLEIMEVNLPTLEGSHSFVRGGYSGQNDYYLTSMGDDSGASALTADQLSSGEGCFMLNGDQSNIQWFQTLGADPVPVPFSTSKRVYASGHFKCDGVTSLGVATYSNEEGKNIVESHTYVDGICSVCKELDMDYCELKDGAYQIGNASQMYWFTQAVKKNYSANVAITADFDYSGYSSRIAGTYTGTFDGQGHTITYAQTSNSANAGFIKNLGAGGVIKNLILDGTITTSGKNAGGICGRCNGTISHCVSLVTINSTFEGDSGHGGLVGQTYNGATIEYSVSAGKFVSENSTHCGGYIGWNDWGATSVTHCLEIMDVELPTKDGSSAFGRGGDYTYANNYYLTPLGDDNGATTVSAGQLSSGEACYLMNGDLVDAQWFQTLGVDESPFPFDTHGRVALMSDAGYATLFAATDVTLNDNVEVFTGKRDGVHFFLHRESNTIPASTAVVLKGEGYYSYTPTTDAAPVAENDLVGTTEPLVADGGQYVLAKPAEGETGFYQAERGTTIDAGKAYLNIGSTAVKYFALNDADGIEEVVPNSDAQQTSDIYDLSGRRTGMVSKGLYIINGKKVLK